LALVVPETGFPSELYEKPHLLIGHLSFESTSQMNLHDRSNQKEHFINMESLAYLTKGNHIM
jgi:hypothetical protein